MIYVASPYSHRDPKIRQERFEKVCDFCSIMINRGLVVYSPIAHNHPISTRKELPKGFEFWKKFDLHILNLCEQITVLCIDGWEESVGVQAEISFARKKNLPVIFRDENYEDIYKATKKFSYKRKKK